MVAVSIVGRETREVCTNIIYLWDEKIRRTEELHACEIGRKRSTKEAAKYFDT
jgi:hypothetical protein